MNDIAATIKKHIKNDWTVFVFPTQVAAELWSDWATRRENTGVTAVSLERFIAWDDFKGQFIKSQLQEKTSIPQVMRSVFADALVEQNAKEPFLKNLINPRYAKTASGFADWIASFLPSLRHWHEKHKAALYSSSIQSDAEDDDMEVIYRFYKTFMDENNLFDPAWEVPPFKSDGRHYYIFYPQILMDYPDYKDILTKNEAYKRSDDKNQCITLIDCPKNENITSSFSAKFFKNSRAEIRQASLFLRSWHEEGVSWNNMAISVPDMDSYGQYLERELSLYQIPYTLRSGKPLGKTPAGNFFTQALECVRDSFSFDSVKNLLTNAALPWKDSKRNEHLIEYGRRNNCLCSYTYDGILFDAWEQSFKSRYDSDAASLYRTLRSVLQEFVSSHSFEAINGTYFKKVRPLLFDMSLCSTRVNAIIGRCLSELGTLIDLEQKFKSCRVAHPFAFFTNLLNKKEYLPQSDSGGVQVFSYRVAACAPFDCHIILDASQDSLSVSKLYKQLSFLNDTKRRALGIEDSDPSLDFINLYKLSALNSVYFSAAEKTFTGYALPHDCLSAKIYAEGDMRENIQKYQQLYNMYADEEMFLPHRLKDTHMSIPAKLYKAQKDGFMAWSRAAKASTEDKSVDSESLFMSIRDYMFDSARGKYRISQTALKSFFICPRLWLFKYVLKAAPLPRETDLMDEYTEGRINHAVMQHYCNALKKRKLRFAAGTDLTAEYQSMLRECVKEAIEQYKQASPLSKELLLGEQNTIYANIEKSIIVFSQWFNGMSVVATEKKYTADFADKDYFITGTVDCLLSDEAGRIALVDYKTSAVPKQLYYKADEPDTMPDFQMPMYAYLLAHADGEKAVSVDNCVFYSIRDRVPKIVLGSIHNDLATKGYQDKDAGEEGERMFFETQKELIKRLDEYMLRIKAKDFGVNGLRQTYDVCTSGDCSDYRAICRSYFTVSGDNLL